ncbi:MAG TPA: 6-carboxytetrahydropterin synthase [Caulobacteraceae bacterium]|jgi:6-pyruvoyltetrahydropterin/6-carboxytetrahydropterin synthase|nr:6-carboxytetrahydropterin synthase [Caulobacteraceae bacterium]
MSARTFEITKARTFDAAHYLDEGPADGRYRRLHGHSFRVEATLAGALAPAGWVADLAALDAALGAIAADLDHGLLNEKPGLETPTLERLCAYFAERLAADFPALSRIVVSRPSLGESCALSL